MAKITKPLTNTEIEKAKPREENYTLTDGGGLFLMVYSSGVKSWKFNYYQPITKKRNKITLGGYPEISLAQARAKRAEYRSLLAQGVDPQIHKQEQKAEQLQALSNTFYKVAETWREKRKNDVEPLTMEKNWLRLEKHLFHKLGDYPITNITPVILIDTLKPLAAEGKSDTLHRLIRLANQILNFAV